MIKIKRISNTEYGTFGVLLKNDVPLMVTLERLPMHNQTNISCIPTGCYECEKITSEKHGKCIAVKNVPDRTNIQIHAGNQLKETEGCILVGLSYGNVFNTYGVVKSRDALAILLSEVPDRFMLEIC